MGHGSAVHSFECSDVKSLARKIKAARELGLVPVIQLFGAFRCRNGEPAFLAGNERVELRRGRLVWLEACSVPDCAECRRNGGPDEVLAPTDKSRIAIELRRS